MISIDELNKYCLEKLAKPKHDRVYLYTLSFKGYISNKKISNVIINIFNGKTDIELVKIYSTIKPIRLNLVFKSYTEICSIPPEIYKAVPFNKSFDLLDSNGNKIFSSMNYGGAKTNKIEFYIKLNENELAAGDTKIAYTLYPSRLPHIKYAFNSEIRNGFAIVSVVLNGIKDYEFSFKDIESYISYFISFSGISKIVLSK